MKNLILIISLIAISFASCKKKSQEPEVVYQDKIVNVYVHDTVWGAGNTYTVYVHDTVSTTPIPLNGIWYCYKMESGGTSTLHNDWIFTFGNTIFTQDLGSGGGGIYNYPITYYSGSVEIFFTGSPTTYYVTSMNNGTEYKLTKTSGTVQSWYLKK